jgi:hypothetical protein
MTSPGREEGLPSAKRSGILSDALDEAVAVIERAQSLDVVARLIGGIAFRAQLPHWSHRRAPAHDIDFVVRSRDAKGFARLLETAGYVPDLKQNALYGHKQLYFVDVENQRPVDVIIDHLEMCHTLDFKDRLEADEVTVGRAELLLSKLQIVRLNRKDALDIAALLSMYPLGGDEGISREVICDLVGQDWGWWRTVTGNLEVVLQLVRSNDEGLDREIAMDVPSKFDVAEQLESLQRLVEKTPKSRSWKWRSRVGERMVWFEEPEEVSH